LSQYGYSSLKSMYCTFESFQTQVGFSLLQFLFV
jgi:hypothetical protein